MLNKKIGSQKYLCGLTLRGYRCAWIKNVFGKIVAKWGSSSHGK